MLHLLLECEVWYWTPAITFMFVFQGQRSLFILINKRQTFTEVLKEVLGVEYFLCRSLVNGLGWSRLTDLPWC